ncbi:DUF4917 family protein [Aeromicrobium yanjiei]|uniref:DUF4917 family protein n=1 Tax=Aeromicrobium yanjiei TaxID=2662028 RepID=UPI001892B552|nr:DUF4917 family protein [Aeromicrobium yanjiei]
MVKRLKTFGEALVSDPDPSHRSVLLGNGFSRAFSDNFAYSRLRDKAQMPKLSVPKTKLFERANSDDFETVMDQLRQAARLVRLYEGRGSRLERALRADERVVKHGLVDAIRLIHPTSAFAVEDAKYSAARDFLSNFNRIFTVNYDLLLYWTLQQTSSASVTRLDGFRRPGGGALRWARPMSKPRQTVFWLHGGVHLFVRDRKVHKLEVGGGNLLDQLAWNLRQGEVPLVVTEGSTGDKIDRIGRSAYLSYCHERLRSLRGTLFIHGLALSPNDDHLIDALGDEGCKVKTVYVGLHGAPSQTRSAVKSRASEIADRRAAASGPPVKIRFYQAETANVWG